MRRVLLSIPGTGLQLHAFGVALLLACVGAIWLSVRRARRERIDPEAVYGLVPWLCGGGILGARLMYLAMHPGQVRGVADVFRFWQGGIIFYGCIVGGLVGSILYWRRARFPFLAMADAAAPALALGIAVGRVGCFLNGCCYGSTCDRPWAVSFPAETAAWARHVEAGWIPGWASHSLPVHPKQLYAALAGVLLLGLLSAFYPRRRRDGEVIILLAIAYPITRFLVEFYRGDAGGLHAGLSISQYVSVGLFVGGLVAWKLLARGPARRHADRPIEGPSPNPRPPTPAGTGLRRAETC